METLPYGLNNKISAKLMDFFVGQGFTPAVIFFKTIRQEQALALRFWKNAPDIL